MKHGLYFNLPDDAYHAAPGLSASGMKNLLVSFPDFWNESWMNLLRRRRTDTDAMLLGRAYHDRILYGKEFFDSRYCPKFVAPDDVLDTVDDLKLFLAAKGLPTSGRKPDLIQRVLDFDHNAPVYDVLREDYLIETHGKVPLKQDLLDDVELAAAMIEKNPATARCFRGGAPEVSVFWEEDGIPMKARMDYIKAGAITDLKSFDNKGRGIDKAVYNAMAAYKYHIQATFYKENAWTAALTAIKRGDVFGNPPEGLCDKMLLNKEPPGFYFVFQKKGLAPLARVYKFDCMGHAGLARVQIADAKRLFQQGIETFGTGPWVDVCDVQAFDDDLFPNYAAEI